VSVLFGSPGARSRFGLFGIPYDTAAGLGRPGARFAPARIRERLAWNLNRVRGNGVYDVEARRVVSFEDALVEDHGDVFISGHDHLRTLEGARALMARLLEAEIFPVALGGDHSVSWPLLDAFHDHHAGRLGIIQLDAHLDLVDENPRQGRYSGSSQMRRALELERYDGTRLVQVGVRGFNYPDQHDFVVEAGIHHITAADVHAFGAHRAAEQALGLASSAGGKLYLSLDADCLDPAYAPGSGADEPGGLTSRQVLDFVRAVAPAVDAMDIVEVNPTADYQDQTSTLAAQVVMTAITSRLSAMSSR
jgi:agmatinase